MRTWLRETNEAHSLKATPFAAHEEGSGEDVLTELVTKEFIHCVQCVNRTLGLVASKEADLAQVYLQFPNCEVLLLASCEYGFALDTLAY